MAMTLFSKNSISLMFLNDLLKEERNHFRNSRKTKKYAFCGMRIN